MAVAANLRLDREPDHERDDRDERDDRRAADDRPGLAADEVAPLVVEGVDAALDPLAELAGGRHRLGCAKEQNVSGRGLHVSSLEAAAGKLAKKGVITRQAWLSASLPHPKQAGSAWTTHTLLFFYISSTR